MKIKLVLIICLFSLTQSFAKITTTRDTSDGTPTAKVFGGRQQYSSWSVGVNVGVLSPFVAIGGTNNFNNADLQLGYGISVKKQLAHSFGLEANLLSGYVAGTAKPIIPSPLVPSGISSFKTHIIVSASLSAVANVATIDFLARKNALNFFVSLGAGYSVYNPTVTFGNGVTQNNQQFHGDGKSDEYLTQYFIPVGGGAKFKLNEKFALNVGYTMNFLDGDYFDAVNVTTTNAQGYKLHKDKYSYGYGGIEYTFGTGSKPNLEWANPVAMMYDELSDPKLRQDVEALKGRVTNVEGSIQAFKKDADNDGVSDQFDKCPNTPAGSVVDGAGCPIKFPY